MIKKHVAQIDLNGCAIACVAMLANVEYKIARHAVFPNKKFRDARFSYNIPPIEDEPLFAGMRRLGLKIHQYSTRNLSVKDIYYRLKHDALLTMSLPNWCRYQDCTHCLAWDAQKKKLYDPGSISSWEQNVGLYDTIANLKYRVIHVIEVLERT